MKRNLTNHFVVKSTKDPAKLRIICFCHAGGYATQYSGWRNFLPQGVECLVYERPGSGIRFGQTVAEDWDSLLKDVWQELSGFLDLPYVVFGHSLGASIGFEFCKLVEQNVARMPRSFIVGDRESPSCAPDKIRYNLSDDKFIQSLIDDYELDHAIVSSPEIMEMFLPVLRSDFKLADTYYNVFSNTSKLAITIPITVIRPEKTNDTLDSHMAWQHVTTDNLQITRINGGHFFNFEFPQETIKILTQGLL